MRANHREAQEPEDTLSLILMIKQWLPFKLVGWGKNEG